MTSGATGRTSPHARSGSFSQDARASRPHCGCAGSSKSSSIRSSFTTAPSTPAEEGRDKLADRPGRIPQYCASNHHRQSTVSRHPHSSTHFPGLQKKHKKHLFRFPSATRKEALSRLNAVSRSGVRPCRDPCYAPSPDRPSFLRSTIHCYRPTTLHSSSRYPPRLSIHALQWLQHPTLSREKHSLQAHPTNQSPTQACHCLFRRLGHHCFSSLTPRHHLFILQDKQRLPQTPRPPNTTTKRQELGSAIHPHFATPATFRRHFQTLRPPRLNPRGK